MVTGGTTVNAFSPKAAATAECGRSSDSSCCSSGSWQESWSGKQLMARRMLASVENVFWDAEFGRGAYGECRGGVGRGEGGRALLRVGCWTLWHRVQGADVGLKLVGIFCFRTARLGVGRTFNLFSELKAAVTLVKKRGYRTACVTDFTRCSCACTYGGSVHSPDNCDAAWPLLANI